MGAKGGPKSGGRQKGTVNKSSVPAQQIADRLGIEPFKILLMFANGDWKGLGYKSKTRTYFTAAGIEAEEDLIKPELRERAASEASQYLYPKRKSIEIETPEDPNKVIECRLSWADEDVDDEVPPQDEAADSSSKKNQ